MKPMRYAIFLGLLAMLVGLPAQTTHSAGNETPAAAGIKNLMGDNFVRVQNILYYLITSHYSEVVNEARQVEAHAQELLTGKVAGQSVKTPSDQFMLYAGRLKASASNLAVVSAEMAMHDQASATTGMLSVDYLRTVAAEHYGDMITACVLCHNQFRRKMVE